MTANWKRRVLLRSVSEVKDVFPSRNVKSSCGLSNFKLNKQREWDKAVTGNWKKRCLIGHHFKMFGADQHIQVSGCAAGRYADGRVQHCSGLFRGTKHTFAPNLEKM